MVLESRVGAGSPNALNCQGRAGQEERKTKRKKFALEGGLEPPTLWLTATRSNQLSYSSKPYNPLLELQSSLQIIYSLSSKGYK